MSELATSIETMQRKSGWLILEDLHLAEPSALSSLQQHLHYLHKTRSLSGNARGLRRTPSIVKPQEDFDEVEGSDNDSKLVVWMTVVTGEASHLPASMLQESFITSWDAVTPQLFEGGGEGKEANGEMNTALKGNLSFPRLKISFPYTTHNGLFSRVVMPLNLQQG